MHFLITAGMQVPAGIGLAITFGMNSIESASRRHTVQSLTAPWRRWIATSLMLGCGVEHVLELLTSNGFDRDECETEIASTTGSSTYVAGRRFADRLAKLESLLNV